MNEVNICLNSMEDAVEFVKCTDRHSSNMDLYYGSSVVDAKSLVGVLGMAIGKTSRLCIYDDQADDILEDIKRFRA